jgi:vancomycin resistance protein VanW
VDIQIASVKQRKLLSQRHPALYFIAVWLRRIKRNIEWYLDNKKYARQYSSEKLSFRIKKHQSVLLKKLGASDMSLQRNKITNLRLAIKHIDGIMIKPGETFSFCKLVGLPTKRKGYLPGMELSFGQARAGIGGGICQISNLIHWLVIHSPLTVTERYLIPSIHSQTMDEFCPLAAVPPFFIIIATFNLQITLVIPSK